MPNNIDEPIESLESLNLPKPGWGTYGSMSSAKSRTFKRFVEMFGRNPSLSELTMLASAYYMNDPNSLNEGGGDAAVAKYYMEQTAGEREEKRISEKAAGNRETVARVFKEQLGRDPSEDELDYFAKQMASGGMTAYQVGQFMQQTPEYVEPRLAKRDTAYFQEQLQPEIERSFAARGRDVGSSGFASALAQAAKQMSTERQNYLEGIGREDYLSQLKNVYGGGGTSAAQMASGYASNPYTMMNDLMNYSFQQNQYNQYLRRMSESQKPGVLDYVNTGLQGLNAVANMKRAYSGF